MPPAQSSVANLLTVAETVGFNAKLSGRRILDIRRLVR